MISYNAALVYSVVLAAAADGRVEEDELKTIKSMTLGLPIFVGFDDAKFLKRRCLHRPFNRRRWIRCSY
ncbi:MAG: hypothetical protein CM15mP62_07240 [Rhodospirillaceae bacterium]|nr:MAG: hypothetical protein CM15mP62_07240 [Rhodospirillaceae bacterium]